MVRVSARQKTRAFPHLRIAALSAALAGLIFILGGLMSPARLDAAAAGLGGTPHINQSQTHKKYAQSRRGYRKRARKWRRYRKRTRRRRSYRRRGYRKRSYRRRAHKRRRYRRRGSKRRAHKKPVIRKPAAAKTAPTASPVEATTSSATLDRRTLSLKNRWTGQHLKVTYRIGDIYQGEALAEINHIMRDWRCNEAVSMDLKLIDLIWRLTRKLKPRRPVEIISGYRSPGLNASLREAGRRAAPASPHTLGKAADIRFPGVSAKKLREAAAELKIGGVGYYPFSGPPFVHLDTGDVRGWEEGPYSQAERKRRKPLKLVCKDPQTTREASPAPDKTAPGKTAPKS